MAADWIKMLCTLPHSVKIDRIARGLGIEPAHALGCVLSFWAWADSVADESGRIDLATRETVDKHGQMSGLAAQMESVGWLFVDNDGITLPEWGVHNSNSAKARALSALRQSRYRGARPSTRPLRERYASVYNTVTRVSTREEKRREEKRREHVDDVDEGERDQAKQKANAKIAALNNAASVPPTGTFYDTAERIIAELFSRKGGLPSHEARVLSEYVGWIESQPAIVIRGQQVSAPELGMKCIEAACKDKIDGTVKGTVAWCRQVFDRCSRQGCWPHESPERKSKLQTVKPVKDITKILEGLE